MPEGVGYGPQNTASVGKELNIIGTHCYAYSGIVNIATTPGTNALEFISPAKYLIVDVSVHTEANSGNNMEWRIKLNNVVVMQTEFDNSHSEETPSFARAVTILIPPFTKFELLGIQGTGALNWTAILTGKVYG